MVREEGHQRHYDGWRIITSLVLDGLSSRHTRRAYSQALDEFLIWFHDDPSREFNKAAVQKYRAELETKGLAPASINVRLSAIRRLALEVADNGVMAPELAAGIARGDDRVFSHPKGQPCWSGTQLPERVGLPTLSIAQFSGPFSSTC